LEPGTDPVLWNPVTWESGESITRYSGNPEPGASHQVQDKQNPDERSSGFFVVSCLAVKRSGSSLFGMGFEAYAWGKQAFHQHDEYLISIQR
jgi:hypothetical protein